MLFVRVAEPLKEAPAVREARRGGGVRTVGAEWSVVVHRSPRGKSVFSGNRAHLSIGRVEPMGADLTRDNVGADEHRRLRSLLGNVCPYLMCPRPTARPTLPLPLTYDDGDLARRH